MLQFDYDKAKMQVRELRSIADDMEKNKSLASAIEKIKSSWEGKASSDFQLKCNELANLIKSEVVNIRNIADSLEQSANAIAKAEREAQDAINTDTIRST